MPQHESFLEPGVAERMSREQLTTIVRRLLSAGMNSEEVKEWFVAELPQALRRAAQMGLRTR